MRNPKELGYRISEGASGGGRNYIKTRLTEKQKPSRKSPKAEDFLQGMS